MLEIAQKHQKGKKKNNKINKSQLLLLSTRQERAASFQLCLACLYSIKSRER